MRLFRFKLRFSKSGLAFVSFVTCAALSLTAIILYVGVHINFSPSLQPGIWIKSDISIQNARGAAVVAKQDGIPGVARYAGKYDLLKRVLAVSGDTVAYDGNNLTVNGAVIKGSRIFEHDSSGNLLPKVSFPVLVPADTVWLCSDAEKGYDSRYFGLVPITNVKYGARLIWRFRSWM